jgi:hypothetical protein
MRAEFEALKSVLFDGNTFDTNGNDNWGEVDKLLTALGDKINEVEKRIECALRCTKNVDKIISIYTDIVDSNEPFKMDVKHHDSILSGSRDVLIALDMEDTECIDNNWYDLFMENMELKPIAVRNIEYDFPQEVYTIGNADNTKIVADVYEDDYIKLCELGLIITESDEGFPNGSMANSLVRSDDFIAVVKSKQIDLSKVPTIPKQADDVAPTKQCSNTHTFDKVKEVIQILKTLDNGDCVDGETMEYILRQVGMEDQMLKQLFPLVNNDELDGLLDIRNEYHSAMMSKKSV